MTPTYVPDLVNSTLDLLLDGARGIVHLTNQGDVSWHQFAHIAAHAGKLDPAFIKSRSWVDMDFKAARPINSALSSERFDILPSLENALGRYFSELEIKVHPQEMNP